MEPRGPHTIPAPVRDNRLQMTSIECCAVADFYHAAEARKIMSEEHKILGFRPPQGSFAAEVQSLAAKHPDGKPGAVLPDTTKLKEIAREDALRIL